MSNRLNVGNPARETTKECLGDTLSTHHEISLAMPTRLRSMRQWTYNLRWLAILCPVVIVTGCSSDDSSNVTDSQDASDATAKDVATPDTEDTADTSNVNDSDVSDTDTDVDDFDANPDTGPEAAVTTPYAEACSAGAVTCPGTSLLCQKFSWGGGALNGYACTETCHSTSDCVESPAGFPTSMCIPFTTASYCVLVCEAAKAGSCPSPLKCVANGGAEAGICVNL